MLSSDDVVDLMRKKRCFLRQQAILTRAPSTPFDKASCFVRYLHDAARIAQNSSVWSFKRLSMSFSRTASAYS